MKFAPMAIPAMALLQQHNAWWDILIEPAARRRAAIKARGHSELGAFGMGAQSGRKNQPACLSLCLSVCLSVCVCMSEVSVVGRFIKCVASLSVNIMDSACLLNSFSGLLLTRYIVLGTDERPFICTLTEEDNIITTSAVALHCCKAHSKINRKMENSTPVKS